MSTSKITFTVLGRETTRRGKVHQAPDAEPFVTFACDVCWVWIEANWGKVSALPGVLAAATKLELDPEGRSDLDDPCWRFCRACEELPENMDGYQNQAWMSTAKPLVLFWELTRRDYCPLDENQTILVIAPSPDKARLYGSRSFPNETYCWASEAKSTVVQVSPEGYGGTDTCWSIRAGED